MGPGIGMCILGTWTDGPYGVNTASVDTLDGLLLFCDTCCMLGRAPKKNETLSDFFFLNMDPNKWDTTV